MFMPISVLQSKCCEIVWPVSSKWVRVFFAVSTIENSLIVANQSILIGMNFRSMRRGIEMRKMSKFAGIEPSISSIQLAVWLESQID